MQPVAIRIIDEKSPWHTSSETVFHNVLHITAFLMRFTFKNINNLHKICYNYKQESQQRVLGSSLPITGGGDTMTKFEKIYLIICILTLVVQIIDLCK